jgi:hypothetical protein
MFDNQQSQRKPLTDYQARQAIELHASGMSNKAIARQLGSSDLIIRRLFVPKKSKPIANKTPPVLHHVRTSSVPMHRRHDYPLLDHTPTRNELLAMLHDSVANTARR